MLKAGVSVPLGVCHRLGTWPCAPTQKLSQPHTFYGGFIMYTYDELLISSPSPLFGQWEGGGSNFQAPNRDVVSLVTSAPPPHSGDHQGSSH